jgi:hypothetical protein
MAQYQMTNSVPMETTDWWFKFALIRMALIFHRGNQRTFSADQERAPVNPIIKFLPAIEAGEVWSQYAAP